MRVRRRDLWAGEELPGTIIVKPSLARLETHDYRVPGSGVMFRCVLARRCVTAADMAAFDASAKMQPPSARSQAFNATCTTGLGRRFDPIALGVHRPLLAVREVRLALSDLYNISVRVANVAASLAVLVLWFCNELGSPTSPKLVAGLNVCDADVHEAADGIRIGRDTERHRRFVGCRAAPDIDNEPGI